MALLHVFKLHVDDLHVHSPLSSFSCTIGFGLKYTFERTAFTGGGLLCTSVINFFLNENVHDHYNVFSQNVVFYVNNFLIFFQIL